MPLDAGGLQHRVDLVRLALPDQVTTAGSAPAPRSSDPARPVGGRQELLGHDALKRDRELNSHLLLLVRREDVDDPVDRLRGVLRVQGREDEVARLGRGQGGRDRLEVTHLTDEDHVGVLAQGGSQGE